MPKSMIGHSNRPVEGRERVSMNVHPDARKRLKEVLFESEMHGVGYSEFINRACEVAEGEIAEERTRAARVPCTCYTKTPDLHYHKLDCKARQAAGI